MQLRQALNSAIERFTARSVPSPRMNAELLLMFTLDCDRAYLYGHPERELTAAESSRYNDTIARRASGIPAQYITGHQEFWGIDLIVSPAVLIPRPETEHVLETVLELAGWKVSGTKSVHPIEALPFKSQQLNANSSDRQEGRGLRIVDVGTGSGAIALALARELPFAEIHATDISAAALEVAQANAARHDLSSRIVFHHADLLGCFRGNLRMQAIPSRTLRESEITTSRIAAPEIAGSAAAGSEIATSRASDPTDLSKPGVEFDLVVSNPPYVGESEEDEVQLEVRKFEPRNAVFAGSTGLEIIERLIPQGREILRPGGWLVFEISGTIADGVRKLLSDWDEVAISNDLQGIPRVARARKPTA